VEVAEAKTRLKEILSKEGFSLDNPEPRIAWTAFKAFALEPVNCADDGVLFECGVSSVWTGKADLFYFGFVRQFSVDLDGEYDHMEQLHCLFSRSPTDDVSLLNTNLWLEQFDGKHVAYFAAVEALPEFQRGIFLKGWKCEIFQEMV
jgi:hypothetical protein